MINIGSKSGKISYLYLSTNEIFPLLEAIWFTVQQQPFLFELMDSITELKNRQKVFFSKKKSEKRVDHLHTHTS